MFNLQKIKIYHVFWIVSLLIIVIALLLGKEATVDVNIHDTYFVLGNYDFAIILFFAYFITGLGYWLVQKKLNKRLVNYLVIIHSVILIGSFVLYWGVFFYTKLFIHSDFPLYDGYLTLNTILVIAFLVIIFIATPIYIINLLIGLFR
ncbi:hypothetical protein [Flavobacterium hungaricum]|uniref:Cytochrome C and Quinol oxidase polypeptide I n=1 Tax=Flavobacterium hungaricum TaxID=2082725 RepID=A0ABR9TPI6_9FLAO|nr:hypothetical protein [Flavobacterium hungaricum]MBE8726714.1 hypothetical protein [Flavobacterium hungaricum]